jgi:hypothetical protein
VACSNCAGLVSLTLFSPQCRKPPSQCRKPPAGWHGGPLEPRIYRCPSPGVALGQLRNKFVCSGASCASVGVMRSSASSQPLHHHVVNCTRSPARACCNLCDSQRCQTSDDTNILVYAFTRFLPDAISLRRKLRSLRIGKGCRRPPTWNAGKSASTVCHGSRGG